MVRSSSSKSVFVCVALGSVILFVLFRSRVVRYVAFCVVQCGVTWHGRVWLDVGFNHKLQQSVQESLNRGLLLKACSARVLIDIWVAL